MRSPTRSPAAGFTLTELLVALGIMALLAALLIPAVMWARHAAHKATCHSNLHQIGIALETYLDVHRDRYPKAAQMPTIASDDPPLREVLSRYIEDSQAAFRCPSDNKYFEREGTSYEYSSRVSGRTRSEIVRRNGQIRYTLGEIMVVYDFEPVHGANFLAGSRNCLFADGRAAPF